MRELLERLKRRLPEVSIPDPLRKLLKRVLPVLIAALMIALQLRRGRLVAPRAVEMPFSSFLDPPSRPLSVDVFSFLLYLDCGPSLSRSLTFLPKRATFQEKLFK